MEVRTQAAVKVGVGGAATTSFGPNVSKEDGRREDGHSDTGKGEGERREVGKGEGQVGTNLEGPRAVESSPPGRMELAPPFRLRQWDRA